MPASENSSPAGEPGGFRHSLDALKQQLARYLHARIALLRCEAGEAARDAAVRGRTLALAAGLLLFGYLLLWAGLLGLAERWQAGSWPIAALIAAGCHLVVGLPLLLTTSRGPSRPWFHESLNQTKQDEEWLRQISQQGHRNPPDK